MEPDEERPGDDDRAMEAREQDWESNEEKHGRFAHWS